MKFARFLRTPYFITTPVADSEVKVSKTSGTKSGVTVSNGYQIQLKKVFAAEKIQKQSPQVFCRLRSETLLKR